MNRARSLIIFFVGAVLAVFAAELMVRVAAPGVDPTRQLRFQTVDPNLPALGPANTRQRQVRNTGDFDVRIDFNALGFRDARLVSAATTEDIILVGDSFTFGWGVPSRDRISERLEALLGRRVFNISTPTDVDGYGALLGYAKARGAAVQDVILALSMETDIIPPADAAVATPPRPDETGLLRGIKETLTANSALYFMVTSLVHGSATIRDAAVRLGLIVPNLAGIRSGSADPAVIDGVAARVAAIAARYHTLVVVIPSRGLWYGQAGTDARSAAEAQHVRVIEALSAKQINLLDLRPAFEATGHPLALHFPNDPHWNADGHRIAALAIRDHLAMHPFSRP